MGMVTTSIDAATGGVLIAWTNPTSNGLPITSYKIEIQDGTLPTAVLRTTTLCDGADNTVFFNR